MECNRDEAVRALDVAETKFFEQDFVAANKFVLKAQKLFPTSEGSQMLEVLEVHIDAQSKLGDSERDWYRILGVDPAADDSTIKKQFRARARRVHPDRNKALGAKEAFQLLEEAKRILNEKRALHDKKRGVTANPPQSHPSHASEIYWTACPHCKTAHQNLRSYEDYPVQCSICKEPFLAREFHGGAAGRGADVSREAKEIGKDKRSKEKDELREGNERLIAKRKESVAMADKMRKVDVRRKAWEAKQAQEVKNRLMAKRKQPVPSAASKQKVDAGTRSERKRKNPDSDVAADEDRKLKRKTQGSDQEDENELEDEHQKVDAGTRSERKRKNPDSDVAADEDRKLKRKTPGSDQEDENELEDEHQKVFEQGLENPPSSPTLPDSRSPCKTSDVPKHEIDEIHGERPSPVDKHAKAEAKAEDEEKFGKEVGRGAGGQRNESGSRGPSVQDDGLSVNLGVGAYRRGLSARRSKGGLRGDNWNSTNSSAKIPTTYDLFSAGGRLGKFVPRLRPDWDVPILPNGAQRRTTLVIASGLGAVFFFEVETKNYLYTFFAEDKMYSTSGQNVQYGIGVRQELQ